MVVAVVVFVLPELVVLPVLLEVIPDVSDVTEVVSEEAVVFATSMIVSLLFFHKNDASLLFCKIPHFADCQTGKQVIFLFFGYHILYYRGCHLSMVQVSYFGKMDFSEYFLEIGLFFLGIVLISLIPSSIFTKNRSIFLESLYN